MRVLKLVVGNRKVAEEEAREPPPPPPHPSNRERVEHLFERREKCI